jgi:glycosyltransferase involved in cell wall biosynthesis
MNQSSRRPAPLFSVLTPVYNTPIPVLRSTIESVLVQTFADFELILVDDCSTEAAVVETLRAYAARDERIRLIERTVNGHIVAASNDGVAAATGEFIALLDHDDLLEPDALARYASVIREVEDVDYIYSDEDTIDLEDRRYGVFRKPDWSPERLRGQMYTCHLSALRADLVRSVGAFREGYDGSQDYDLVLRVTERARRIVHVPDVLYHWRAVPGSTAADADAKPYAYEAARHAIQDHLDRVGIKGTVQIGKAPGTYVIERELDADVRVSLIIPTVGTSGVVWGRSRCYVVEAVRSMLEKTSHQNVEVVVVYDRSTPPEVLDQLHTVAGERLVLVPFERPFSHSEKMNIGMLHSTGDRLVLLNDDIEVISDRWLEELVAPLDEADVGLTGAKLFLSNTTIQHAGHAYAWGDYYHPYFRKEASFRGPFNNLIINREASGVTAACSAIRRETYLEIGGFAEGLPTTYNDVDFSYKVRHLGYRIVWLSGVELYHFESVSRGHRRFLPEEQRFCWSRWGRPVNDPYLPQPMPQKSPKTKKVST